jgi:hypothetical protein
MALPMAPGERIAITMFMEVTPFARVYGIGLKYTMLVIKFAQSTDYAQDYTDKRQHPLPFIAGLFSAIADYPRGTEAG